MLQQICSNPDTETAFDVIVKRRRAGVKVSTLSAEQKRELVTLKDKELQTFVKYFVVEAASGSRSIAFCSCEKCGWQQRSKMMVNEKTWLVVQGFTDPNLGKIPTTSPTASR